MSVSALKDLQALQKDVNIPRLIVLQKGGWLWGGGCRGVPLCSLTSRRPGHRAAPLLLCWVLLLYFRTARTEGVKTIKGEPLHSYLVADETASIQLCLWGDMGTVLRPGDICELRLGCACTVEMQCIGMHVR